MTTAQAGHVPDCHPPKAPNLSEWQKLRLTAEEILRYVSADTNIGIILGEPSRRVDVDLDCIEALAVADAFLPNSGQVYARPSKSRPHRWCCPNPIPPTKQYNEISKPHAPGGRTAPESE